MSKKKVSVLRSIIWLLIGGAIEFFSMLLMIYAYLDYSIPYISNSAFFQNEGDFTIAALGFALSLACILVCIQKAQKDSDHLKDLFNKNKS